MPATLFHKITESFAGSLYVGQSDANLLYLEQVALRSDTPAQLVDSMVRVLDDMRYLSGNTVSAPSHVVRFMGQIGIVSPYFEAVPLRLVQVAAREKQMPIPVRIATKIALDVFDGICQYHALDTKLYGGICPDHVLVGTDGDTRLGNIPVSAITPKESPWRGKVERLAYLAPEQVTATHGYDAMTDVYTIGLILWEMIANQSRLTGSPLQILETLRAAEGTPDLDPLDETKISKGLYNALARAMHADPEARQPSIGAFALDLLEGEEEPASASEVAEYVEQVCKETLQLLRTAVTLRQIETIKQSRTPMSTAPGDRAIQKVEAEQLLACARDARPPSMPPNADRTAVFNVTAELLQKARRGALQPPPKPAPMLPDVPLGSDRTVTFEVPDDLLEEARRLFEATENAPLATEIEKNPAVSTKGMDAVATVKPPAPVASGRPPSAYTTTAKTHPVVHAVPRPGVPTTDQRRAEELLQQLRSDSPTSSRSTRAEAPKVEDDVTTIWRPERDSVHTPVPSERQQQRPRSSREPSATVIHSHEAEVSRKAPPPGLQQGGVEKPSLPPNRLSYWLLGLAVSVVVGAITVYASHYLGH